MLLAVVGGAYIDADLLAVLATIQTIALAWIAFQASKRRNK
jgi:hypothetical protein